MKQPIIITVQPDVAYFHWQIEVQLVNFLNLGIDMTRVHVLWSTIGKASPQVKDLEARFPTTKFFYYKRLTVQDGGYIPVIRPDLLAQHFKVHRGLSQEPIFYCDSDILFREVLNWDLMLNDDICYVSDTIGYLGAKHLRSRGEDLFQRMCAKVKIDPNLVIDNELNTGGAQYILKNIDFTFWERMTREVVQLYRLANVEERNVRRRLSAKDNKTYNPFQKWIVDMVALFWGLLKDGRTVRIHPELEFSWGGMKIDKYYDSKILHNAGVTSNDEGKVFYKADYIKRDVFAANFDSIDPGTTSFIYVNAIKDVLEYRKKIEYRPNSKIHVLT